jgi:putative transposase
MFVRVGGKQMYLWRAVDAEGEVLDVLLQAKRDTKAALVCSLRSGPP